MISRKWPAPAKINLFLHITGRRDDGYHLLQTVFQFMDFCDYLDFEVQPEPIICRKTQIANVPEQDDLIVRAAALLQAESDCTQGVDIHIDKKIPMQGGLGGGSSDAATTLVALNHLWGLGLGVEALAQIGVQLGADVPVFIHGYAAFAEGVGEKLTPVEPQEKYYVLIRPDCEISTAEIFNAEDLTRNTPPITIRDFLANGGHNDCLPVVRKRYPQVVQALDWLEQYSNAKLTGTGSCVYAEFETQAQAQQTVSQLPEQWYGVACKAINRSPLLDRLTVEADN